MPLPGIRVDEWQRVAEASGLCFEAIRDIASYEDEVATALSIRHIIDLSEATKIDYEALIGVDTNSSVGDLSPQKFCDIFKSYIDKNNLSIDAFGEEVGWEVATLIDDPSSLYELNWDGLSCISKPLGIDPLSVFPIRKI